MVDILAVGLSGTYFGYEASSFFTAEGTSPGVGQMLVAYDPDFLSGGSFLMRFDKLIAEIT